MSNDEKSSGAAMRLFRRAVSIGWKLVLLAAIVAFVVYRMRFAPIPVESRLVTSGPIVQEVMGTGTLESRVSATIGPRISGLITQVLTDQGDRVIKGQLLAALYDGDLRQQVEMAKADLAASKAGVDRAAADITAAEATAVQARASYARNSQLVAQKLISPDEFDKATQQRDVAEAPAEAGATCQSRNRATGHQGGRDPSLLSGASGGHPDYQPPRWTGDPPQPRAGRCGSSRQ